MEGCLGMTNNKKHAGFAIAAANNHYAGFGAAIANSLRKMVGLKEAVWEEMKQRRRL
jgi:hypothetical protein